MKQTPIATITEHFSKLDDPRSDNRWHLLLDIIVIAICAVICGADGWADIELRDAPHFLDTFDLSEL